MRQQFTSILSGWDNILPDELDKTKYKGMLTIPELVQLLNKYKSTLEIVEQLKKELDEHIHDTNNPHKVEFNPCDFNISYLLFREYQDKFNYTGTFSEFVKNLYDQLEIASPNDLNDPIHNQNKFVNIATLDEAINRHNHDPDAHPEILQELHAGEPFDIYPRYIISPKNTNNEYKISSTSQWYVHSLNGMISLIQSNTNLIHHTNNVPTFPLFPTRTNYVPNSEVFNNPNLSGLIKYTNQDIIPSLRNNYNYLPVVEAGTGYIEHYIAKNYYNIPNNRWITLSFYYYPYLRDILNIKLNNNVQFQIQVTNNTIQLIKNTTGQRVNIRIEKYPSGYYRIQCTFYNNFSFNYLKINFNDYLDDNLIYQANSSTLAGIFYQLQIENTFIASPPIITSSSQVTINNSYCNVPLSELRTIEQGTIVFNIEAINPVNWLSYIFDIKISNKRISAYIQNYNLYLRTIIGSQTYTETISDINYTQPFKIVVSYGNSGVIYGVTGKSISLKGDVNYTQVPELNALITNIQDINNNDVLKLSEYPYITFKTLNNLNETMDNVINYLIPHLSAERDSNILTAIDTSVNRTEDTILGVDRYPNTSDILHIGCDLNNNYRMCGYLSSIVIYDIAANQNNVSYLLNKHYNPYTLY